MSEDTDTKTKTDDEIEVVEVEKLPEPGQEPAAGGGDKGADGDKDGDKEADKGAAIAAASGDDDDDEDERIADRDGDEDDDSPARKKRLRRKQLQRIAKQRTEEELRLLRMNNRALEERLVALETSRATDGVAAIDAQINQNRLDIRRAEAILARALEDGNGADATEAIRLRDEARDELAKLESTKTQMEESRKAPAAPAADRVQAHAREWMAANPWFTPKGDDDLSKLTSAIDAQIAQEGFNPAEESYWKELTKRVGAAINVPDDEGSRRKAKTDEGDADAGGKKEPEGKRRGPPTGPGSREHASQSTKDRVYVTPERKQAMIDAGMWDDPQRRNRMLRRYAEFDRNRSAGS